MTDDVLTGSLEAASEAATGRLERRYQRLLRLYPAAYRRQRGPEMIGTLLDAAAPGQTRPTFREVSSLVIGGVRAQAGVNVRQPLATALRMSLVYAGLLGIVVNGAMDVAVVLRQHRYLHSPFLLMLGAMAAAVILVWARRPQWVLALVAVPPYIRWHYRPMHATAVDYLEIVLFSGLPFLLIGLAGRRRDPRPTAAFGLLHGVCGVLFALAGFGPATIGSPVATACWEIGGLLLLAYGLVDGRVALAFAVVMVARFAMYAVITGRVSFSSPIALGIWVSVPIVVPVAAGIVLGILGSRRQAVR